MRTNDLEFEYNKREDGYIYINEERLEEEIWEQLKKNTDVEKLRIPEEISRDAYLSLTKGREDIIRWYPFKKESSILEVGAGYGELTDYLCGKLNWVTAYELKEERIKIIKEHCRGRKNLECIGGFLEEQEFDRKYDYILLHDIFAFSRKFFKGKNPNVEMLNFLRQFLLPEGKLILITENRLGLKYFAGAAEDYTQQYFWGLNNFEQDERNRTFSRQELKEILEESGFTNTNWFYPYPNAVLPLEIFSEKIQDKISYGSTYPDYECCSERYQLFDEQRMFYTLYKEGIVYQFANAFWVECSIQPQKNDIAYVNIKENYSIHYDEKEKKFKCNGKILPEGVRLDIYLKHLMIKAVNCNLGNENPYISQFYDVIRQTEPYLSNRAYQLEDFYIEEDEVVPIDIKRGNSEDIQYHKWKVIYQWYYQHIMFYRNAYRRIKLEKVMEAVSVEIENTAQYLQRWQKENRNNNYVPRLPQMMFDFEAGGYRDALIFDRDSLEENGLAEKLRNLHKGLMDEED